MMPEYLRCPICSKTYVIGDGMAETYCGIEVVTALVLADKPIYHNLRCKRCIAAYKDERYLQELSDARGVGVPD